jgi:multidrug resistance efflux pump
MRILLLLSTSLLLSGCEKAHSSAPAAPSPYRATAEGRIDSADEARQLVAAVDGVIDQVFVARGQAVTKGQPLLAVNCAPRQQEVTARHNMTLQAGAAARKLRQNERASEIAAANAQVAGAAAAVREQEQRLAIASDLKERGFVSEREFSAQTNSRDASRAEFSAAQATRAQLNDTSRRPEIAEARAAVGVASAQTAVARAAADQCTLRSPLGGTVLQILRQQGEFSGASQGTPLIIVGDLSQMIVRAGFNERDAVHLREGQRAVVWIEGRLDKWQGHLTHLASVMGRRTARSLNPTDRFDQDTREGFVTFDGGIPPALVGLRVTVGVLK